MTETIGLNWWLMLSFVVGILLTIVFVITIICITFRTTTGSLAEVFKGPMLPLITVVIIVTTVSLLGLVGILKENSITAILSGVVGYVLGGVKGSDKGKISQA